MRPFFRIIFGVLFGCSAALAQMSVPVFKTKEDSAVYANLQVQLNSTRLGLSTAQAGTAEFDSLKKAMEGQMRESMTLMTTRMLRLRTIYRSDPMMTGYTDMVRSRNPSSVHRLSIPGKGRTSLPDSLFLCTNLEELELVNWKLSRLPRKLNKLSHLRELTILNNQPSSRLKLVRNKSIKELNIRGDEANSKLPVNYRKFKSLQLLDLSRNNLTKVPTLRGSNDLKKVNLLFNDITLEGLRGRQPRSLVELNLANNKVTSIPNSISAFSSLRKLNFNNNKIDTVHAGISKLAKLEEISLYNNKLKNIPAAIYTLPNLKVVDLYYNDISRADSRLGEMKNLEILYLANNKLFTLPDNLGQLPRLQELYLHHNKLSNLPESVAQLRQLKVLRINDNQLLELPESVLQLSQLQNLDISHNQIQYMSFDKFEFKELKILALVGNPWDEPTREALPAFALKLRQNNTIVHLNTYEDSVE